MVVKPVQTDSAADLLDRLNTVRLARDWSYRQLADDIERVTGLEISAQTLQPLLSVPREERAQPYDRTVYKIREYFKALDKKSEPAKKRHIA